MLEEGILLGRLMHEVAYYELHVPVVVTRLHIPVTKFTVGVADFYENKGRWRLMLGYDPLAPRITVKDFLDMCDAALEAPYRLPNGKKAHVRKSTSVYMGNNGEITETGIKTVKFGEGGIHVIVRYTGG